MVANGRHPQTNESGLNFKVAPIDGTVSTIVTCNCTELWPANVARNNVTESTSAAKTAARHRKSFAAARDYVQRLG